MANQVAGIKLIDNSDKILKAESRAIEAALMKIGGAARDNIKDIVLSKDVYDTGDLYRTIDYNVNSSNQSVAIGSPQSYAGYQELGTSRVTARPFVKPGILDNASEYKNILENTLKNA